jgi:glycosyltransferase involved in cell wall biosynthesis
VRIAYYMPFKPLGHPVPSGDLIIGSELGEHLAGRGHTVTLVSRLRARWIFWKPWKLLRVPLERRRILRHARTFRPQAWLTYHTYYKAPDLLGPACAGTLGIPYVVFQGIYATRPGKHWLTRPGFASNTTALQAAAMVFTNKRNDEANLRRLVPGERVCYVPAGIRPQAFRHDPQARQALRQAWGVAGDLPVILSAAMFRPGVKTEGLGQVIQACARLRASGRPLRLVICGDGPRRAFLEALARRSGLADTHFGGRIPRAEMARWYSAADVFAFPGIREGLGMVYLEAQAAGLPVVAYGGWGAVEVVADGATGCLADPCRPETFTQGIARLLDDPDLRRRMGVAAADHVRRSHDLESNYETMSRILERLVPGT